MERMPGTINSKHSDDECAFVSLVLGIVLGW